MYSCLGQIQNLVVPSSCIVGDFKVAKSRSLSAVLWIFVCMKEYHIYSKTLSLKMLKAKQILKWIL